MITFVLIFLIFFAFFRNIWNMVLKKTLVLYGFSRVDEVRSDTLEGRQKR